jgi:hypothetical protein
MEGRGEDPTNILIRQIRNNKEKNFKTLFAEKRCQAKFFSKPVYNAGEERPTSHRKRKLMPPAKPSRISKKAIIKAIEKVIAQRPAH